MNSTRKRKFIGKRDFIILAAILLAGAAGMAFSYASRGEDNPPPLDADAGLPSGADRLYADIYYLDQVIDKAYLDEDAEYQMEFNPEVTIRVKGGSIAFTHSNCLDQLCVKMGEQNYEGGFAACLPNKVFFIVENEGAGRQPDKTDITTK
jgi:hypothetical protein